MMYKMVHELVTVNPLKYLTLVVRVTHHHHSYLKIITLLTHIFRMFRDMHMVEP